MKYIVPIFISTSIIGAGFAIESMTFITTTLVFGYFWLGFALGENTGANKNREGSWRDRLKN